jgi:hypothetical protein
VSTENDGAIISQEKIPNSSSTVLWQSYRHSHVVAKREKFGDGNEFGHEVSLLMLQGTFKMP